MSKTRMERMLNTSKLSNGLNDDDVDFLTRLFNEAQNETATKKNAGPKDVQNVLKKPENKRRLAAILGKAKAQAARDHQNANGNSSGLFPARVLVSTQEDEKEYKTQKAILEGFKSQPTFPPQVEPTDPAAKKAGVTYVSLAEWNKFQHAKKCVASYERSQRTLESTKPELLDNQSKLQKIGNAPALKTITQT